MSHPARGPMLCMWIDGQANAAGRRHVEMKFCQSNLGGGE